MSLIEYTLDGKVDKVKMAIERIKTFDPSQSEALQDLAPYYVAYSGGKDSDVLRILFELSGVKYDLAHSHTTIDAPETVRYIRSIPNVQTSYPETSIWGLIVKKRMPPTRLVRYCCSYLKERGGTGRFVATGVRWAESNQRKSRNSVEIVTSSKKSRVVMSADNDESRRQLETCIKKGRRVLNPIIDWTDGEVWEFLNHYNCKSNPLYGCGYKRVGCVGCPMSGRKGMLADFERYPKYKENYIKAFDRMLQKVIDDGRVPMDWKTGEEVFDWWVSDYKPSKECEHQQSLFKDYRA